MREKFVLNNFCRIKIPLTISCMLLIVHSKKYLGIFISVVWHNYKNFQQKLPFMVRLEISGVANSNGIQRLTGLYKHEHVYVCQKDAMVFINGNTKCSNMVVFHSEGLIITCGLPSHSGQKERALFGNKNKFKKFIFLSMLGSIKIILHWLLRKRNAPSTLCQYILV